jgi:hypothetical protein
MQSFRISVFIVAGMIVAGLSAVAAQTARTTGTGEKEATSAPVTDPSASDSKGNLHVPADYRTRYQYLGSWAVAAEGKGSKEMHSVYASPGVAAAYTKDGHFTDGAVLVKEVFETETEDMTTGTVSHVKTLIGWFVMVRDSRDSHPGNKLWGDGWGWAWFDKSDSAKTTTVDFKSECQTCHIPAKGTEWIYVHGYPSLNR